MKREIRQVSEDGKTVQVTLADERWYIKTEKDDSGRIISMKEYPSVTWIADHYPKGVGYYRWLADKGWDNADAIMTAAGRKGSKVHQAITSLLLGNEIRMDDEFINRDTEKPEALMLEEYEALMTFAAWHAEVKPKMIANEMTVFNDEHLYAGTMDFLCEIELPVPVITKAKVASTSLSRDGSRLDFNLTDVERVTKHRWLIDFKTSKDVWPSHELQVSAYAHALPPELRPDKLAILQVGYRRNKNGWKLTEIEDKFNLFLSAKAIWKNECSTVKVFKKDYPTSLSLSL